MNNACPGCGAVYNVTAKDIGRRLKCKKCGSPMLIGENGIEPEGAAAPVHAAPVHAAPVQEEFDDIPAPRRRGRNVNPAQINEAYQKYGSVFSTLVFGFGAFLVIFQLFMPLVAEAKIAGRVARRAEAEKEFQNEMDRINKDKDIKDKAKLIEDLRKAHEEDTKTLSDKIDSATTARSTSLYFDRYFMMFGFILVMIASLMFMMPDQPPVKRVVGAIVVTAQMVFVFIAFLARSVAVG